MSRCRRCFPPAPGLVFDVCQGVLLYPHILQHTGLIAITADPRARAPGEPSCVARLIQRLVARGTQT
eukprot:1575268-Lingulodinium_polyedra.AAC.1